jgi:hypothetical protein
LPNPYKLHEDSDGYYFVTDFEVIYRVVFDGLGDLFIDYPLIHRRIFSFSFHPTYPTLLSKRYDPRVKDTLADIVHQFFNNQSNLIVFVCDSTDGKENCRKRLFESWFDEYNNNILEKHDGYIAKGKAEQIQNSIILRSDLEDKKYVLEIFQGLNDELTLSKP